MRGWHWLYREWRGGRSSDLSILFGALTMSVAIVAGIGLFGERLQRALDAQAASYLAGDIAVSSGYEIPSVFTVEAQQLGLNTSRTVNFSTMAYPLDDDSDGILVDVKGVSAQYPLRGEVEFAYGVGQEVEGNALHFIPSGTALVAQQYLDRAQLSIGDSIYVGDLTVQIIGTVDREPDQGFSALSYGPRILINALDVGSTMAVRKGSRVTFMQQFKGESEAIETFKTWLEANVTQDIRIRELSDGQPQLANALTRAKQFLLLCGALGVALAGVAMSLAGRRYSRYLLDAVAVKKTLGATPKRITQLLGEKLMTLWLTATVSGLLLALIIQEIIASLIQAWIAVDLPWPTPLGAGLGILTSAISLVAFLGPPIYQLREVPPLRVIRRELGDTGSVVIAAIIGLVAFAGLLILYTGSPWVILGLASALLVAAILASILAWLLFSGKRKLIQASSPWRLAVSALQRHRWLTVGQVVAFSMTLCLLSTAILVRTELIGEWQDSMPEDAPNHFFINIADYQAENVDFTFKFEDIDYSRLYPMVRGRIVAINDIDAKERAKNKNYRYVGRELNLSYTNEIPLDNEIVGGHWWAPDEEGAFISIEQEFAQQIGVSIGDTITLDIAGQAITATVSSLRTLSWDDLRPAFYVILSPASLENFGATWMTSAYVPQDRPDFIPSFLREFSTVTVIDVGYIINQVRQVVSQVSQAVELVLSLVGVSAVLVLLATVRSSQDWRLRESAVLRALGASRQRLLGALIIEFTILGLLSGLLGAFMSEAAVAVIQIKQFDLPFNWHWQLWILLPICSVLIVTAFGVLTSRQVVSVPPNQLLRDIA